MLQRGKPREVLLYFKVGDMYPPVAAPHGTHTAVVRYKPVIASSASIVADDDIVSERAGPG